MRTLILRPSAKINLTLRVGPLRPDGYHEVRSLMQSIALHDTITISERRGPFGLQCRTPGVPSDHSNLAWRAADSLWKAMGHEGEPRDAHVRIEKVIPSQAGLGGGSANAAAALVGAVRRLGGRCTGWQRRERHPRRDLPGRHAAQLCRRRPGGADPGSRACLCDSAGLRRRLPPHHRARLPGQHQRSRGVRMATRSRKGFLGDDHIRQAQKTMGAEDFGYMTQLSRGAMFRLGVKFPGAEPRFLHTATFDLDEDALAGGVAIVAETALPFSRGEF